MAGPPLFGSGRTPHRTGSSGRTYRWTVTRPITEPRPDPETGPTSDDVLEWFPQPQALAVLFIIII